MDTTYSITSKTKNKHLSLQHIEFIINRIIEFNAFNKNLKRNIGKTTFIQALAKTVNTSVSNIYSIIKDATITVKTSELKLYSELSASAAYAKRSKSNTQSNHLKRDTADAFITLVVNEMKNNKLSSIDETINYLKIHGKDQIKNMDVICPKTFYNYIHAGLVDIKPIDLPRMLRRKVKNYKTYIPKRQKGTSITQRPFDMEDRSEFGHWEGDLVTGPRDGKNGAYLTIIERQTRFYYMIPIKSKSAKQVYMQINKLHKFYGNSFSDIFKSITFDNGSEFSRYKDIEIKPGTNIQRTNVFFGRPYRSCDRGSNENCNGLIRYFIKKGTDINTISKEMTLDINTKINQKKRKILGYLSSETVFLNALSKLNVTNNTIFYAN